RPGQRDVERARGRARAACISATIDQQSPEFQGETRTARRATRARPAASALAFRAALTSLWPADFQLGLACLLADVAQRKGVLARLLRREQDLAVGAFAVVLGDLLLVGVPDVEVHVGLGVALDGDLGLLVRGEGQGDVRLAVLRLQLERLAL